MNHKTLLILATTLSIVACVNSKPGKTPEKELYLPAKVYLVPDSNNYNNPESDYCYKHMIQSENIALFWHKEYGDNPMQNPIEQKRFNPEEAITECERFFHYYVNELKLVETGKTFFDKYKLLIFVFGGDEGTAFGGGEEDKVGILWTPAVRINRKPYGALAHEMMHSFQYISEKDNSTGPNGPVIEMSAQYALWQVYPEWMTFENYHLVDFLKGTHYAFLHPVNMYHSPYVLEYWSQKHGKEFFGKLSRSTQPGEDPVATYKRITGIGQELFNDELFDASRRFITWDLARINSVARPYANKHTTKLTTLQNGWYQIDSVNCPQNYGYNGISLKVPEAGTKLVLEFKGIAGAKGFSSVKTDKAGWRYGFVALLTNGSRVYSDIYKKSTGRAEFTVPQNTHYLWLVVSGAPTAHWPIVFNWEAPAQTPDEQWPYEFKLTGTLPE